MKKRYKIALMIVLTMVLVAINIGMVYATSGVTDTMNSIGTGTAVSDSSGLTKVVKVVLGVIRLLTGLLSIIVIAYTGFELVTETPEGKKKVKEKMVPIVIGVLLVFMATNIATFIIGIFENNGTGSNSTDSQGYPSSYNGKQHGGD